MGMQIAIDLRKINWCTHCDSASRCRNSHIASMSAGPTRQQPPTRRAPPLIHSPTASGRNVAAPFQALATESQRSPLFG